MALTIDWSLAPDDATHYDELADVFCNERGYWCADNHWSNDHCQEDWGTSRYIHRPASPWNGVGLPPVGTHVVIHDDGSLIYGHGESGEVIAHVEDTAVVRMSYGLGCFTAECLRTPEQIAAEERENEVNRMVATTSMLDKGWARKVCESLYDAGYRKVTEADHG